MLVSCQGFSLSLEIRQVRFLYRVTTLYNLLLVITLRIRLNGVVRILLVLPRMHVVIFLRSYIERDKMFRLDS